jgi:hypothetical protein
MPIWFPCSVPHWTDFLLWHSAICKGKEGNSLNNKFYSPYNFSHARIYAKWRKTYLAGHILFIAIYASICTSFTLLYGFQNPGMYVLWIISKKNTCNFSPTTGNIGEILPQIGIKWYLSIMIPMIGSILCYCLIGAIVRRNKSGNEFGEVGGGDGWEEN